MKSSQMIFLLLIGLFRPVWHLSHSAYLLLPLRSREKHIRLPFLPQHLNTAQIVIVMLLFVVRSILNACGFSHPAHSRQRRVTDSAIELPKISLSMPFEADANVVAKYNSALEVVDPARIHESDAQLCFMMSAFSEPAMLLLLGKKGNPIQPLGAVNVRNRFELLRPDLCVPSKLSTLAGKTVIATLVPVTRPVKRGLEIDIEVRVEGSQRAGSQPEVIFKQIFTMLQFMKTSSATPTLPEPSKSGVGMPFSLSDAVSTEIKVSTQAPTRWASVCKDYNPIHLSALASRAFGFPGKIAHGNHVAALAVQAISAEPTESVMFASTARRSSWLEVNFARPVILPSNLIVKYDRLSQHGQHINVMVIEQKGKPCTHAAMGTL